MTRREFRQYFADGAGKFKAMAGKARAYRNVRITGKAIENEMLVRRHRVSTGGAFYDFRCDARHVPFDIFGHIMAVVLERAERRQYAVFRNRAERAVVSSGFDAFPSEVGKAEINAFGQVEQERRKTIWLIFIRDRLEPSDRPPDR